MAVSLAEDFLNRLQLGPKRLSKCFGILSGCFPNTLIAYCTILVSLALPLTPGAEITGAQDPLRFLSLIIIKIPVNPEETGDMRLLLIPVGVTGHPFSVSPTPQPL